MIEYSIKKTNIGGILLSIWNNVKLHFLADSNKENDFVVERFYVDY